MRRLSLLSVLTFAALLNVPAAQAQQPAAPAPLPLLGATVTLEQAKKVAAAAEAEAKKNNWTMVIVVAEPNGQLVYLQKMDGTQYGSLAVATDKATSSALFRRPTTAIDTALRAGNNYLLMMRGASGVPGGQPLLMDGKLIGAIGVSGATGAQDDQVAVVGAAAMK